MSHTRRLASAFLWLAALPLLAQTGSSPSAPAGKAGKQNSAAAHETHLPDGQRVFDQNCSRCHTAPEGFSPNISGTIVRHMRVRASLSKEDEKALLRFLNP
jgi:cytochrome c5